jgi:hypothetical protein
MSTLEQAYKKVYSESTEDQHSVASLLRQQITKSAPEFVSLEYTSSKGETSKQTINVGVSYQNVLENSLNQLAAIDKESIKQEASSKGLDTALVDTAVVEIEGSLSRSLSRPEQMDIADVSNFETLSKGIKMNRATGELFLSGLVRSKTVITPGTYKEVKSRPLTLVKKLIEKHLMFNKYRMFKLSPQQIHQVSSEGKTLTIN